MPAAVARDAVADVATLLRHALERASHFPARETALARLQQAAGGAGEQLRDAVDAAATHVDANAVAHALSPQELCVLRASLHRASEQLSSEAAAQLEAVSANLERAIQRRLTAGQSELATALHGDAAALRSMVMDGVDAKAEIQRVGRSLVKILSMGSLLSNESREALRRMADAGTPLPSWAVEELSQAKAIAACATQCSKEELAQLRDAMGRAASSGVAVELMSLWVLVHSSISSLVPTESLSSLVSEAIDATEPLQRAAVSEAQAIGRLLQLALSSSMSLASSVSVELQDAVKNMAEHGVSLPSSEHIRQEIVTNAALIAHSLPRDKLVELETHIRQATTTEWKDLHEFATTLKQTVAMLPPVPSSVVDVLKQSAADVVYDNAFTTALLNSGLEKKLDGFVLDTRERVHEAVSAIGNGMSLSTGWIAEIVRALPPLLRVEILRDFAQTMSLFFTNLYGTLQKYKDAPWIRGTQLFFQSMFNIASADFTALWAGKRELLIDVGFGSLLFLIIATYGAYLWFAFSGRHLHRRSDEIRHGHEATSWAKIASEQQMRLRAFTVVITLCLSVYLPLTRLCLEIIAAAIVETQLSSSSIGDLVSPSTLTIVQRYSNISVLWVVLRIGAVVLLVTFTAPLPVLLVRAITENKPTGSPENPLITYDVDGEPVPFDDKVYARLVASDPSQLRCPYRSLYAGFEQRWSHYKVFQLLFKVALIVPLILTRNRGIRSIVTSVIYSLIVLVTSYGTPFNDPLNNVMELSGKIAALVTCIGGVLLAFFADHERIQLVVGVVVNIVNGVNLVIMVGILLFGMKKTRLWIKNRLGTLTFSDTVRDIHDAPAANIIPSWDLEKEIKHRIWHHFWESTLLSLEGSQVIIQRLASLQHAVTESGVENVKRHWQGQSVEYIASMRMAARRMLEGVDVFWDDASGARDGFLDSKSCFGKMYIRPYPFHCVVVYDDSKDEAIVRDDKFPSFFFLNFSPAIQSRRLLRQKLRALSEAEVQIYFPFSRQETVTVEDGTETTTTTNAEGKTETTTKTRYTTVEFTCYYTTGVVHVGANSNHEMSAGFNFTMTYSDGHGDAIAPHTGQVHHQQNRVATMAPSHVGLTPEMQESEQLQGIFQQTQSRWIPGVAQLQERYHQYRMRLIDRHTAANRILGDGFWYFVLNNSRLPRYKLRQYLETEETSPVLRKLAETHAGALDFLYHRMGFVHSHLACSLWYVFWDDVFGRNGDMGRLKPFARDLDPSVPSSIAYRVLKREELMAWLKQKKLWGRPFSWRTIALGTRCLFHDRTLQLLYERMHRLMEPDAVPVKPNR